LYKFRLKRKSSVNFTRRAPTTMGARDTTQHDVDVRDVKIMHKQQHFYADEKVEKPCNVIPAEPEEPETGGGMHGGQKLTFWQAVGMNTMNMFGTGPLITIPYCVASVDPMGPHAVWGYGVACIACLCDSFVWGEIGSMWPESGGPYVYLRELYGPQTWGRLASFIFVWQFFISGPAEAASGFVAIAEYMAYFSPDTVTYGYRVLISLSLLAFCTFLLCRKMTDIGSATTVMWIITIIAMIYTILAGFTCWDAENLRSHPDAFSSVGNGLWIIAAGTRFGVYDMTGYYDVCFMGGEVVNPRRTIPLSCLLTCFVCAIIFILCYTSVLGSMPWTDYIHQYTEHYEGVPVGIMSLFTEWRFGSPALAGIVTIVTAITIFGSTFSMLVGFVFVPVAAARDGYFFSFFAPPKDAPSSSLPVVSLCFILTLTGIFSFFSLGIVIDAMCTMIVFVMFCGQSAGLIYYRYTVPVEDQAEGWRMPFFPFPCIVQFILFFFIFATSQTSSRGEEPLLELAILFLILGVIVFLLRSRKNHTWPFELPEDDWLSNSEYDDIEQHVDSTPTAKLTSSPTQHMKTMQQVLDLDVDMDMVDLVLEDLPCSPGSEMTSQLQDFPLSPPSLIPPNSPHHMSEVSL